MEGQTLSRQPPTHPQHRSPHTTDTQTDTHSHHTAGILTHTCTLMHTHHTHGLDKAEPCLGHSYRRQGAGKGPLLPSWPPYSPPLVPVLESDMGTGPRGQPWRPQAGPGVRLKAPRPAVPASPMPGSMPRAVPRVPSLDPHEETMREAVIPVLQTRKPRPGAESHSARSVLCQVACRQWLCQALACLPSDPPAAHVRVDTNHVPRLPARPSPWEVWWATGGWQEGRGRLSSLCPCWVAPWAVVGTPLCHQLWGKVPSIKSSIAGALGWLSGLSI